ncbi:MAG: sensor histidine kinase, partial [Gammaproteobacteria bacterium]
ISHEIRTPMNGILGMAQLIAAESGDPATQSRVTAIIESGENLLLVLSDVIDVAQAESGTLELRSAPFASRELASAILSRYAAAAADKGLALDCEVAPGVPSALLGDARRVEQILSNLVGNAIKFTATGRVLLRLDWDEAASPRPVLVCTVKDSGIGMSRRDLDRLFTLFQQAEGTHARGAGGLGLGLAIVRHLSGLMGGDVSAESVQGLGSAFTVRLPLPTA